MEMIVAQSSVRYFFFVLETMNDIPAESSEGAAANFLAQKSALERQFQHYLDQSTPYTQYRWIGTVVLMLLFLLRVVFAEGWYIVCYALGIYILNLFLAFLTPKFDPAMEMDTQENEVEEGPTLPMKADEEFKPFIRRLPEFKFWYSVTKATTIAFVCSFFRIFDIPVFWPILLVYFCILFAITMRRQIRHMVKYKYIPFDLGKKNYRNNK
ncbi:RER1 protein [Radiomyces spectabilis]|uniref:RER1 protein n=1 Tax=Radiomyces spectabilis TaxID=64574 RepID=UPI00221EF244|nr:RER1 protein [Radiomyces spectabilis]KAI8379576.1 RER1 protein [Radiomyces spectabilis]